MMSAHTDSIIRLFDSLCILQLGAKQRFYHVQPKIGHDVQFKRLRQLAFNTLFDFLRSPDRIHGTRKNAVSAEVHGVLQYVYHLRIARRFDDANRLEQLLESILENPCDETMTVLRLLVCLTASGDSAKPVLLGHNLFRLPVIESAKLDDNMVLPSGPLCYGDTLMNVDKKIIGVGPYMLFPRSVFEVDNERANFRQQTESKTLNIFELPPGVGIGGGNLFSTEKEFRDYHEQATRMSMFGGLVRSENVTLQVRLQLPDLPSNPLLSPPVITYPKPLQIRELSEDEGFVTAETSSSVASSLDDLSEDDIWEAALATTPKQHYVWERIGCEPMRTEQWYLTEAGPEVMGELCSLQLRSERLISPDAPLVQCRHLTNAQLIKDIVYLLIGISSQTFHYSVEQDCFFLVPGTFVSGISSEALQSFLDDFVKCGTFYQRLATFAVPQELDSLYTSGLVLQAFTGAIRSALQHYRVAILTIPREVTLLSLRMHCQKVFQQMKYLADLCFCTEKVHDLKQSSAFPTGVPLITYLYQETMAALNTENYILMMSLLRTTCQPFIQFVQDWVFHGTFRDVYGEFMIQINTCFLEARDETYWEKGFTLAMAHGAGGMPLFLADLALAIFSSGKSLNLLRMCNAQHFLCGLNDNEIPHVSISYSREELQDISKQCQMYVSRMRQVARQLSVSRAEHKRRIKEAKKELMETARHIAAAEIARLQGDIDKRKKRADDKKRIEFKRLKDQMNADLKRRSEEASEEKERDRALMAQLDRREEMMTEKEIKLEMQARDELIAYYTHLGEEASKREQKALWKIRRARLETARTELLMQDAARWQVEMEEHRQAQELIQKSSIIHTLPSWAQMENSTTMPLVVTGTDAHWDLKEGQQRDWSLPKWAEQKSEATQIVACTSEELPSPVGEIPSNELDLAVMNLATFAEDMPIVAQNVSNSAADKSFSCTSDSPAVSSQLILTESMGEEQMAQWVNGEVQQKGIENPELLVLLGIDDAVVTKCNNMDDNLGQSDTFGKSDSSMLKVDDVSLSEPSQGIKVVPLQTNEKEQVSDLEKQLKESFSPPEITANLSGHRKIKTHVHMVGGASVVQESEEKLALPHIHMSTYQSAITESAPEGEIRAHVKKVLGMSATRETEADDTCKPHIKLSDQMSATKETEEIVKKPFIRFQTNQHSGTESQEEIKPFPKMGHKTSAHIGLETESAEWKIKKPNLFGHISQLSRLDHTIQAPRLKHTGGMHVGLESDFREFAVKPQIKMHKTVSASMETKEQEEKLHIRVSKQSYATKESEYVDWDEIRRKKFKQRNVYGHSSDSTVQKLLYGEKFGSRAGSDEESEQEMQQLVPVFELSFLDLMKDELERFQDNFDHLNFFPMVDLLTSIPGVVYSGIRRYGDNMDREYSDAITFTPLPILLSHGLTAPLSAQISLVNETVVNYFLVDLKIDEHFEALHNFLFMADGDFAQNLTDILLEKLSVSMLPRDMLTPVFLNSVLTKSLQLSSSSDQRHGDALSFALRYMPDVFRHNAHDTLDCLELRYKVTWPLNVILTESSMACYGRVFSFMLHLKRVDWTLKDCWHRLKRDAIVKKAKDSVQFRQLQLHRQEMLHFVRVMQGYMANQIIQVTWKELQESLDRDVHSLDDLRRVHGDYLNKALFRCLLNKKAVPIMKLIQDIFCLILKFCSQLASASWSQDPISREVTHSNFTSMMASYKAFKEYFDFLFKVVNKLAVRGYQPHLQELLLRLNFNDFYNA